MTYQQPFKGKQTVRRHKPEDVTRCGEFYVSTYNGDSWKQTNCNRANIEKVKAEHLADTEFMNRHSVEPTPELFKEIFQTPE